jgi:hypothetical protein
LAAAAAVGVVVVVDIPPVGSINLEAEETVTGAVYIHIDIL